MSVTKDSAYGDVLATLQTPCFYPDYDGDVRFIETHASAVFVVGEDVFKLKKPVDFGFLDYGSPARRRLMCHLEVQLNRQLAPDVYQGVVELVLRDGCLKLGGEGSAVDYLVHMRRLPDEATLASLIASDTIQPDTIERVARRIARFHREANRSPEIDRWGLPAAVRRNVEENFDQVAPFVDRVISDRAYQQIARYARRFLSEHSGLFHLRVLDGLTRDGHGDIRAEHVYVQDDVKIIDRIEFNDRIRYGDVAADVGFLAMDLDAFNRPDLSDLLVESYVRWSGLEIGPVLDFYRCYRAYVRGKVTSFRLDEAEPDHQEQILDEARKFFHLAWRYAAADRRPRLLIMSGLSGSGKSTLAHRLAGILPARVLDSDTTRKHLAGIEPTSRQHVDFGSGIYSPEMTAQVYQELLVRAKPLLEQGQTVILDATYTSLDERRAAMQLARDSGAEFLTVACQTPEHVVRDRLTRRGKDPTHVSDGRWEIYVGQKKAADPISTSEEPNTVQVDTSGSDKAQIEIVLAYLEDT